MAKYEVLQEVELDGVTHPVGAHITADEGVAAPLVEDGTLKASDEDAELPSQDDDLAPAVKSYKVLQPVDYNGGHYEVDTMLQLTEEDASPLVADGTLELAEAGMNEDDSNKPEPVRSDSDQQAVV